MIKLLLCAAVASGLLLVVFNSSDLSRVAIPVTDIGELLEHPERFEGNKVRIQGEVASAALILGVGGYELRQKDGRAILVVSRSGAPATGRTVTITGTFNEAVRFDGGRDPVAISLRYPVILADS